ncbi:hypothetical protein LCGC14_2272860, partial [marine sediment metagenome]
MIPTYKRFAKLCRCIESIFHQTHQDFDIYVIFDNSNYRTYERLEKKYKEQINYNVLKNQNYVIGIWNWFTKNHFYEIPESMIWLCDDTELYPNCLEELNKFYTKHFPYLDGVIGIKQEV